MVRVKGSILAIIALDTIRDFERKVSHLIDSDERVLEIESARQGKMISSGRVHSI